MTALCAGAADTRAALAAVPVHAGTGWRKSGRASGLLTPSPMQHVERLEPPVSATKRRRRAIGFAGPGCTGCSFGCDAGFHVLRHWDWLPRIAFSPEARRAVADPTALRVVHVQCVIAADTVSRRRSHALMKDATPSASSFSQTARRSMPIASSAVQVARASSMREEMVSPAKVP